MNELNRILYVEDDEDIQAVGTLSLETVGGFTLKAASSGAEALAALGSFSPQLILLDVMMPGQDGPATLRAIRERESMRDIPVIFLTAKAQKHETQEYIALGAIGVITKPFDPIKLPELIRQLWRKHVDNRK
jgi:CheY-like chemotaxis protein